MYVKSKQSNIWGQHTWFYKSKGLYLKEKELSSKLEKFENGEIYLDDLEQLQLNTELDEIGEFNEANYFDLFRTSKRSDDGSYIDYAIFSRNECFEFIDNPNNFVSFKNSVHDTDEQEKLNQERSIRRLNEFWNEHSEGVIDFG